MHKGFSKRKGQDVTSCKQLDFDWHQSSPKSNIPTEGTETDICTIGHPSSGHKPDRLFVPLADRPFSWFRSGEKKWELRRLGRQYTLKHVRIGRLVELRRGYKGPDALWGEILNVIEASNIENFFNEVDFKDVIPVADSREHAIQIATDILKVDRTTPVLGFAVGCR